MCVPTWSQRVQHPQLITSSLAHMVDEWSISGSQLVDKSLLGIPIGKGWNRVGFGNLVFILFTNPSLQNTEVPVDFRKDSDTAALSQWWKLSCMVDHISAALGEGAKLSFHLNETAEYRDLVIFAKLSWVLSAGWSQMRRAAFERMEVEVNPLTRRSWNCWWKKSSSGVCTVRTRLVRCNWTYNFTQFSGVPQQVGDVFHTAVFTLQVRYVRPWIPVAKLCPWILRHLDGRAPPSGESIAEILLNQARLKLCTSKVASAAINSDWGDVSREVEAPYIGEWGSAWVLTNCSAGWSSRYHASVHKLAPGFQHLPSLNIQRFTSEIGTKWCHKSTGEGQLENVLVALTRKKNAQDCSKHGADISSSFFHPGNFVGGFRSWLATVQRSG